LASHEGRDNPIYQEVFVLQNLQDKDSQRHGTLHPIDPHKRLKNLQPGDFLSADILGPFPLSVKGNRFIIVVTDLLTRFVVCGALVDSTAFTVAEFLVNQVICVYGAFRFLLTDNE
jgi:hypothetical protein